jgi:hypothetical protein
MPVFTDQLRGLVVFFDARERTPKTDQSGALVRTFGMKPNRRPISPNTTGSSVLADARPRWLALLPFLGLSLGCTAAVDAADADESTSATSEAYTSGLAVSAAENQTAPLGAAVLLNFGGVSCSGVKIGAKRFLTAGHCISESRRNVNISNGLTETPGPLFTIPAGHVWVHPTMQLAALTSNLIPNNLYDVAMFDVNETSSGIPVVSPTGQPVLGTVTLTAVGYGGTGSSCSAAGTQKLRAGVTSGSDAVVDRFAHFILDVGDPSSCEGDSGGPLIRGVGTSSNPTLVGLDSASSHPSNPANSSTIFARLSNVFEWINDPTDSTLGNVAGLIADNKAVYLMSGSLEGSPVRPTLRCVAQNGTGATSGTDVRLHTCDGDSGFFSGNGPGWRLLTSSAGGFKLVNRLNGLCLATTTSPGNLTNVFVSTCATTTGTTLSSQSWTFEPVTPAGSTSVGVAYRLHNVRSSGLCLGTFTGGGAENDDVVVVNCNSTSSQQWFVTR